MSDVNPRPSRWKSCLVAAVIFLSGSIFGFVGTTWYVVKRVEHFFSSDSAERTDLFMKRLTRRLELSPDQIAKIRPEVEAVQKQLQLLREQHWSEVRSKIAEGKSRIEGELTSEQKSRFERFMQKLEKRFRGEHRHFRRFKKFFGGRGEAESEDLSAATPTERQKE